MTVGIVVRGPELKYAVAGGLDYALQYAMQYALQYALQYVLQYAALEDGPGVIVQ